MSRYLLLLILCSPFIVAGLLNAVVSYKLKKISKRSFISQVVLWLIFLVGLIAAEPLYDWLFANNLTRTDTLSLFDVVQITAIIALFYTTNRFSARIDSLENRLADLHRELSIKLSNK